jgi:hypothetical protein
MGNVVFHLVRHYQATVFQPPKFITFATLADIAQKPHGIPCSNKTVYLFLCSISAAAVTI